MALVAPLLVLVTFARRFAAKAKKSATAKARVTNPKSVERGAYREWDDYAMECALSELAECADHKNDHLKFNMKKTSEIGEFLVKLLLATFIPLAILTTPRIVAAS